MSSDPARPVLFSSAGDEGPPSATEPTPDPETITEGAATTVLSKPTKRRASEVLPASRISVSKQLDILRAQVIAYTQKGGPVSNAEVAQIVRMHVNNSLIPNAFFVACGLLQKQDGGHVPSQEAMSYGQTYEWTPDTAGKKLAPAFERSWFGRTAISLLTLRPRPEREIVTALAEASSAPPEDKPSLLMLLEFLTIAGLIVREGENWKAVRQGASSGPPEAVSASPVAAEAREKPAPPVRGGWDVPESQQRPSSSGGGVQFSVTINVDMEKMGGWTADRIAAFFLGLAQVIAADKGVPTTKS
jgi:hypothetical protein